MEGALCIPGVKGFTSPKGAVAILSNLGEALNNCLSQQQPGG